MLGSSTSREQLTKMEARGRIQKNNPKSQHARKLDKMLRHSVRDRREDVYILGVSDGREVWLKIGEKKAKESCRLSLGE